MTHTPFETPNWYEALTLTERLSSPQGGNRDTYGEETPFDSDLASKRLNRWRAQSPFENDARFSQRLSAEEVTESDLLRLLGERADQLRRRIGSAPAWLQEIERLYAAWADEQMEKEAEASDDLGFLWIARPLILDGRKRFRQAVGDLRRSDESVPFDLDTVEELFIPGLVSQLATI